MSESAGTRLVDRYKIVDAFGPALPSTSTSSYVDFALYNHATIIISVQNATTVTGSAITLTQATNVSAGSAKGLNFASMYANTDVATNKDALTLTTVNSNTFTTSAVNSKISQYIIEVNATDLDFNNNFTCLQVALATGVATSVQVTIIMSGATFGGNVAQMPSALT